MTIRLSDRELLESVRSSPAGQELIAQREAALMDDRRQQAAELAERRQELDKGLPSYDVAVEKAKARLEETQIARLEALNALGEARVAKKGFLGGLNRRIEDLESELRNTAPQAVKDFIGGQVIVDGRAVFTGLEGELDRTKRQPVTDTLTGRPIVGRWTNNRAHLGDRIKAIRRAQEKASALLLEVLTPEEVGERLEAIRGEIPEL